jgi:hypothetical protein
VLINVKPIDVDAFSSSLVNLVKAIGSAEGALLVGRVTDNRSLAIRFVFYLDVLILGRLTNSL